MGESGGWVTIFGGIPELRAAGGRSRRGGRRHGGFGVTNAAEGVSNWQTVGGSRRSRRSRLGSGGDMMTHMFPGAWYRFPDGLNRMRGGGSRLDLVNF